MMNKLMSKLMSKLKLTKATLFVVSCVLLAAVVGCPDHKEITQSTPCVPYPVCADNEGGCHNDVDGTWAPFKCCREDSDPRGKLAAKICDTSLLPKVNAAGAPVGDAVAPQ